MVGTSGQQTAVGRSLAGPGGFRDEHRFLGFRLETNFRDGEISKDQEKKNKKKGLADDITV